MPLVIRCVYSAVVKLRLYSAFVNLCLYSAVANLCLDSAVVTVKLSLYSVVVKLCLYSAVVEMLLGTPMFMIHGAAQPTIFSLPVVFYIHLVVCLLVKLLVQLLSEVGFARGVDLVMLGFRHWKLKCMTPSHLRPCTV